MQEKPLVYETDTSKNRNKGSRDTPEARAERKAVASAQSAEVVESIFREFDADCNGFLDKHEVRPPPDAPAHLALSHIFFPSLTLSLALRSSQSRTLPPSALTGPPPVQKSRRGDQ